MFNFFYLVKKLFENNSISFKKNILNQIFKYKILIISITTVSLASGLFLVKNREKEWQGELEILVDSSYPLSLRSSLNTERQILENPKFYKDIFESYKYKKSFLKNEIVYDSYRDFMLSFVISQKYSMGNQVDNNFLIVKFKDNDTEIISFILKELIQNYKKESDLQKKKNISLTTEFINKALGIQEIKIKNLNDNFNLFHIKENIKLIPKTPEDKANFYEYYQLFGKIENIPYTIDFNNTHSSYFPFISLNILFKENSNRLNTFYNEQYSEIHNTKINKNEIDLIKAPFDLETFDEYKHYFKELYSRKRMLEKLKLNLDLLNLRYSDDPIWIYISTPKIYQINNPSIFKVFTLSIIAGFILSLIIIIFNDEYKKYF